jgi:hypothetical protein
MKSKFVRELVTDPNSESIDGLALGAEVFDKCDRLLGV